MFERLAVVVIAAMASGCGADPSIKAQDETSEEPVVEAQAEKEDGGVEKPWASMPKAPSMDMPSLPSIGFSGQTFFSPVGIEVGECLFQDAKLAKASVKVVLDCPDGLYEVSEEISENEAVQLLLTENDSIWFEYEHNTEKAYIVYDINANEILDEDDEFHELEEK